MAQCNADAQVARVRRDLPVRRRRVSATLRPRRGGAAGRSASRIYSVGVADVTCTLYPDARHEIFNETNRDEVTADVVEWLDAHLPA